MLDISEKEALWKLARYLIETDRISIKYNELIEWAEVEGLTAEIMAIGQYLGEKDMAKRFPNG